MANDRISSLFDDELDDIQVVSGVQSEAKAMPAPPAPAPVVSPAPAAAAAPRQTQDARPKIQVPAPQKPAAPSISRPAVVVREQRGPAPVQGKAPVPSVSSVSQDLKTQYAEDQAVIKQVTEKELSGKIDSQKTQTVGSLVAGLADEAMSVIGIPFENEDLRRRFHAIVESYFKDLRDGIETRSKLVLAKPSGGMGMADGQADRVMGTLTVKQAEFEAAMRERLQTEKKAFVAQRAEKQLTERDDFERKEKTDLDRRYARLTGTEPPVLSGIEGLPEPKPAAKPMQPPKVIQVVQQPKEARRPDSTTAGQPAAPAVPAKADTFDGFFKKAEKAVAAGLSSRGSEAPLRDASASKPVSPSPQPSPAGGRGSMGGGITPVAPKPLTSVPPAPIFKPAPQSVASVPPPTPITGKPVVSDVKSAPTRLTGPVEELRSISVRDFRHLSKIPTEATLRIKDKIDLLEEQSFPQKTAGIAAWRESPTNKLYLDILRQSLEGIPVADIIGKMETEGKETLTKAEFDSIMGLNRMLRFG